MRLDDIHSMRVRDVTDGYAQTMDAREYFTCGRCWELAEALGEIVPGGRIVEIRVSIASISMLLPAGVESGGFVHDIEGTNEVSEWIARWSGNLEGATMALRKGRGQSLGFETQRTMTIARFFARILATALSISDDTAEFGEKGTDIKKAA